MAEAVLEFKEYRNADGQSLLVAFVGGKPVYPIPAGYTLYNPEAVEEEPSETTETAEETNEVIKQAVSSSSEKDASDLPKSEFQLAGSWDGASLDLVYKEGSKFVGGAADLAAGAVGVLAGPIAPVVYLFTKLEKRKYESKLDGYIARAKKEGRQDLVEKFTAHKKALAEGGQGLIGKAINAVSKIFSPEDVETEIKRVANEVSAEPANVESDVVNQTVTTKSTPPSYATMDVGEAGRGEPTTQAPVPETDPYAGDIVTTDVRTPDPRTGGGVSDTYTPSYVGSLDAASQYKQPPTSIEDAEAQYSTSPEITFEESEKLFRRLPFHREGFPDAAESQDPYADLDKYPLPPPAPISGPKQSELAGGVATISQPYTSTGAQMEASQKALQDVAPILPDSAPMLEPYEPAPITTGRGYDTSLGQDTSSYAVTPEQVAYSTSVSKGQEDPYDPRGIMPISEQVTRAQPVTTQAQTEAPSMDMPMPYAFIAPPPKPKSDAYVGKFPPLSPEAPEAVDILPPRMDTTGGTQIRADRGFVPTNIADPAATAETVKPVSEVATDRGYVPTNVADPAITVDTSGDYADPRGREQLPSVEQKLSSLRPKARPTVTQETTETVTPTEKVTKKPKPEPKPEPVRDQKATRLDSTNPNTSTNITNHLSETEKTSLKANPSLAAHYTATANRRANEASRGDTSNTDAAKEKDNKIVCTAMNNAYGFGSYRQAIWLSYSKDYLTKEHEIGYHTMFLPLVDLAYNKNNKFVRTVLEHIARHRTADLRASMQNKKRNTLGRIYRCVLEPLVYTIGKFRIITGI